MSEKRPFHEVVSEKLLCSPITGPVILTQAGQIMALLVILRESKMPAKAAHEIARVNTQLPHLLADIGCNPSMAGLAREVLADLKAREDEAGISEFPKIAIENLASHEPEPAKQADGDPHDGDALSTAGALTIMTES